MNNDDIIDVEFNEKESHNVNEESVENQSLGAYTSSNDYNKTYENYSSNVKFIKLNPIIGMLVFIVIAVLLVIFASFVGIIIVCVAGFLIIVNFIAKMINKFKGN